MITIRGSITAADYAEALQLQARPRRAFLFLGALLICLFIWGFCVTSREAWLSTGSWMWPAIYAWGVVSAPFGYFFALPYRARKIYRQQRSLQEPFESQVDETGLHSKTERSTGFADWSYFKKWAEGRNVFLLYQSDVIMNIIPKRLFVEPQGVDEFRLLVARLLPRAANNSARAADRVGSLT